LTLIVPGGYATLGPITVTVNLTQTVQIDRSSADWRRMLIQALGEGNRKIVLAPGVDMDMSGLYRIRIAGNVTLTGELPALNHGGAARGTGTHRTRLGRPLSQRGGRRPAEPRL
jgi:hypothetical protein